MAVAIRCTSGTALGRQSIRAAADAGRDARAEALLRDDATGEIRMIEADPRIDDRRLHAGPGEAAVAHVADAGERRGDRHVSAAAAVEIDALHGRIGFKRIEGVAIDLEHERGDAFEASQFGEAARGQSGKHAVGVNRDALAACHRLRRLVSGRAGKYQYHARVALRGDLQRDIAARFRRGLRVRETECQREHDDVQQPADQARSIHVQAPQHSASTRRIRVRRIVREHDTRRTGGCKPGRRGDAYRGAAAGQHRFVV